MPISDFFAGIFAKPKAKSEHKPSFLDNPELTGEMSKPLKKLVSSIQKNAITIHTEKVSENKKLSIGASKFGGFPDMKPGFVWPSYTYTEDGEQTTRPMAFLVQINLEETAEFDTEKRLPERGMLYFFYETLSKEWGFKPDVKGYFKVIFDDSGEELSRITPPDVLFDTNNKCLLKGVYDERALTFDNQDDFPDSFSFLMEEVIRLNEKDSDAYGTFFADMTCEPDYAKSKLLGWTHFIQDDICNDCEKVMGNGSDNIPPEDYLKWQLLLQLDSCIDTDEPIWDDEGALYFAIRQDDLKKRAFDKCHLVYQCT
jgi:uncharacterized protein YwqG